MFYKLKNTYDILSFIYYVFILYIFNYIYTYIKHYIYIMFNVNGATPTKYLLKKNNRI